jgi:hypothetical protein
MAGFPHTLAGDVDETIKLLTQSALSQQEQTAVVAMLQSWIDDEDEQEQQETGQYLTQCLI